MFLWTTFVLVILHEGDKGIKRLPYIRYGDSRAPFPSNSRNNSWGKSLILSVYILFYRVLVYFIEKLKCIVYSDEIRYDQKFL